MLLYATFEGSMLETNASSLVLTFLIRYPSLYSYDSTNSAAVLYYNLFICI